MTIDSAASRLTPGLLGILAFVGAVGPLAIDMYLPGLPDIARDFHSDASTVQLTLTGFLVGAAAGQFVVGPLSDQLGRRRLLIVGMAVATAAGIACALAPGVGWLVAARVLQGLGASAGMVLGRAVVTDLTDGAEGIRMFSILMAVQAAGPVIAPLLGGVLLGPVGWRGIYGVLAGLTAAMLVAVVWRVPETRPPEARTPGGLGGAVRGAGTVLRSRRFLAFTLTYTLSFAVMFAYISGSPFVMQEVMGLSAGQFSVAFTLNAGGLFLANVANARLGRRVRPERLLALGVTWMTSTVVGLLVVVLAFDVPRVPMLALFFLLLGSIGLIFANGAGMALQAARPLTGTGSAVMGTVQFVIAGVVAPLVGIAGAGSAVPMVLVMAVCAAGMSTAAVVALRTPPPAVLPSDA